MGNRAKSLFCSVLFNEFHHRTNLVVHFSALLYLKDNYEVRISKFSIQIPTYNGNMKILFSEFHHRTNMTAPL
jgi:hypothetical protein